MRLELRTSPRHRRRREPRRCHADRGKRELSLALLLAAGSSQADRCPETQIVFAADSEADIFEVITAGMEQPHSIDWIVRACQDRGLAGNAAETAAAPQHLREAVAATPVRMSKRSPSEAASPKWIATSGAVASHGSPARRSSKRERPVLLSAPPGVRTGKCPTSRSTPC